MNLSQELIQSAILLVLGALVSGLLIPYIFRVIDERRAQKRREEDERKQREQMRFEAELERQSKIIESQVALLEQFSDKVWRFQLSAIEVMYYYQFPEEPTYDVVLTNYKQTVGGMLVEIRSLISKSIRLMPVETYQTLVDLYYKDLLELDKKLQQLAAHDDPKTKKLPEQWRILNKTTVYSLAERVDMAINMMAESMNLKVIS